MFLLFKQLFSIWFMHICAFKSLMLNNECQSIYLENGKQGQIHKWHSLMDHFAWTCQCWPTSKNLPTTALHRHRIEFGKLVGSDEWQGHTYIYIYIYIYRERERERERESQGNPCLQCNLMLMMINHPLETDYSKDLFQNDQVFGSR